MSLTKGLAGWVVTLIFSLALTNPANSQRVYNNSEPGANELIVSVKDNSDASVLNATQLLMAVIEPQSNPELYAQLGEPRFAEKMAYRSPSGVDANEEVNHINAIADQYVVIRYATESQLLAAETALASDDRLAYVGRNSFGDFSAVPVDKYYSYPGGLPPYNLYWNDYYWGFQSWNTHVAQAWDRIHGWANVGVIDGGVQSQPIIFGDYNSANYKATHADLQRIIANNYSSSLYDRKISGTVYGSHGTHVAGLIAANTESAPLAAGVADPRGGVGVCRGCTLFYVESSISTLQLQRSITWLVDQGAQIINVSGGWDRYVYGYRTAPYPSGLPCSAVFSAFDFPVCIALAYAAVRDVVIVAAAGNARQPEIQFPANDPRVIGVGGTDSLGNLWDDVAMGATWIPETYDYNDGGKYSFCPDPSKYLGLVAPFEECGSNYSSAYSEMDFVAAARKVISAVPVGQNLSSLYDDFYFNDRNFVGGSGAGAVDDGFAYATGTSMSTPIVSGIIGLLRSVNPLVKRAALYDALKDTASNAGIYNGGPTFPNKKAWGVPNAEAAVMRLLGRVNSNFVRNRLTPMFTTISTDDLGGARFYSTRPQSIIGAESGGYFTNLVGGSGGNSYQTILAYSEASPVSGYDFPGYFCTGALEARPVALELGANASHNTIAPSSILERPCPLSAFWVFTTQVPPKKGWNIKPLYRMSFRDSCPGQMQRHAYPVSDPEINSYLTTPVCATPAFPGISTQFFRYDGIEGYILDSCPEGYTCNNVNDPTEPQKLHRIFSTSEGRSALVLAGQLASPYWGAYLGSSGVAEPGWTVKEIGYAFPNVDSDGDSLPDGLERLYGMNPASSDSDCDGITDGIEFPIAGVQSTSLDPLLGGTCP